MKFCWHCWHEIKEEPAIVSTGCKKIPMKQKTSTDGDGYLTFVYTVTDECCKCNQLRTKETWHYSKNR